MAYTQLVGILMPETSQGQSRRRSSKDAGGLTLSCLQVAYLSQLGLVDEHVLFHRRPLRSNTYFIIVVAGGTPTGLPGHLSKSEVYNQKVQLTSRRTPKSQLAHRPGHTDEYFVLSFHLDVPRLRLLSVQATNDKFTIGLLM